MKFPPHAVAKVHSASIRGIDGYMVEVEVDLSPGLPSFVVVGLPDAGAKESRERVRAAIGNVRKDFPVRRITVNLAPANVRKEGPRFDLPMALAILAAAGEIGPERLGGIVVIGELSLTGEVRPIPGVLSAALAARAAGFRKMLLPEANVREAGAVRKLEPVPVRTLQDCLEYLAGGETPVAGWREPEMTESAAADAGVDFAEVRGQEHAKRALEIAAAGGHNVLMLGPPGAGKSMLARRLPTILPRLSNEEALELTKIHSVAGLIPAGLGLLRSRPFRAPHHTVSDVGLAGGGATPRVGEVSLAHLGVLFLDELPEFRRHVLEVLRQPLEEGRVSIVRAGYSAIYPSRFSLVAAMNPCPCGHLTDPRKSCRCTAQEIKRYHARISGPLLDRIDLHVEVPAVNFRQLTDPKEGEGSVQIAQRVRKARARQVRRFKASDRRRGAPPGLTNARMTSRQVRRYCRLGSEGEDLLKSACEQFALSARAYDRVLKVARTIADLEMEEAIGLQHLAEALQYRVLDRGGW